VKKHIPVLKKESIDLLNIKKGGTYIDCTLGEGGHAAEIINNLNTGNLIALDVDQKHVDDFVKETSEIGDVHIYARNANFSNLERIVDSLKDEGVTKVDGILFDLGWATDQLERMEGLSYMSKDDELDMRLDMSYGVKASDLLNGLGSKELEKMFSDYADIQGSILKKLSEAIKIERKRKMFSKVDDLNKLIDKTFKFDPVREKSKRMSFLSKVYQALRIAVNNEMYNLKLALEDLKKVLNPGGRVVIITFHSGEENLVKDYFKRSAADKFKEVAFEVRPTVDELLVNLSSRSAKLYCYEYQG
jgi:16S rRNA (cytosine1402-N4)-methyltransferase